jgi:hypothetical protein
MGGNCPGVAADLTLPNVSPSGCVRSSSQQNPEPTPGPPPPPPPAGPPPRPPPPPPPPRAAESDPDRGGSHPQPEGDRIGPW